MVVTGRVSSEDGNRFEALPFFATAQQNEADRYDVEGQSETAHTVGRLVAFPAQSIRRDFQLGTDTWTAGDLTFTLYSRVQGVPDPETSSAASLQSVLAPYIVAEITVDNSAGNKSRRAFFGYEGSDPYSAMRRLDDTTNLVGVGQGRMTATVTDAPGVKSALHFSMENILSNVIEDNWTFGLGKVGALILDVPAGERRTVRFAVCFFRSGIVTAGLETSYYYTRFFDRIEAVAMYAVACWNDLVAVAHEADAMLQRAKLSADQKFMLVG